MQTRGAAAVRVLVTGGRGYLDGARVASELAALHRLHGAELVVVHGDCPTGADAIADEWCKRNGVACEPFPADWNAGRGGGPRRNQAMVDAGADLCLAFPGGRGTADCIRRARAAGIPVWNVARLDFGGEGKG